MFQKSSSFKQILKYHNFASSRFQLNRFKIQKVLSIKIRCDVLLLMSSQIKVVIYFEKKSIVQLKWKSSLKKMIIETNFCVSVAFSSQFSEYKHHFEITFFQSKKSNFFFIHFNYHSL